MLSSAKGIPSLLAIGPETACGRRGLGRDLAGVFGGAASLAVVAFEAAGDDVVPGLASPLDDRNDVVEREVLGRAAAAAVLARVVVARVNVGPAKLHMLEALPDPDVLQEAQHARQLDREADAPDLPVVLGYYFDLALVKQRQCALPGDDVDRFVARVKK